MRTVWVPEQCFQIRSTYFTGDTQCRGNSFSRYSLAVSSQNDHHGHSGLISLFSYLAFPFRILLIYFVKISFSPHNNHVVHINRQNILKTEAQREMMTLVRSLHRKYSSVWTSWECWSPLNHTFHYSLCSSFPAFLLGKLWKYFEEKGLDILKKNSPGDWNSAWKHPSDPETIAKQH